MAEIFGISVTGGSSGEGATLTVIAPQNTQSITIKKGEKTYTKQGTTAEFKNLEAGTWEITSLSTTGQVSGKKEVTIVLQYSSQTAYFAANIQVTYPAGSTCTCSKGEIVLNAPDTTGSHIFVVPEVGEWIVSSTDGELTDSESVIISSDGESKSVTLEYFTATIVTTFPTDCTSVTCTKGDTIFSVPSGELSKGSYTFSVHETGEWTLECTNGTDTDSTTVNVTEEKAYSASLSFTLILFDNGSYAPETGGWTGIKNKKLEATSRRQDGGVNSIVPWYSNNGIDVSGFDTLKFNVDFGVIGEGDPDREDRVELVVGLTTDANKATTSPSKMTAKKSVSGATGIYELDISSINGVYHVTGITDGGAWTSVVKTSRTTTIKVWLE